MNHSTQQREPSSPEVAGAALRVVYGWGAYQDFTDLPSALRFMIECLEQPTHDPLLRHVKLLDLDADKRAENGYYVTLVAGESPLEQR